MFSEDRLNATVDLTETLESRFAPCIKAKLHFITRVDMRKESDGKYRICRQEDNYPNDLQRSGIPLFWIPTITATYKIVAGTIISYVGRFLLEKDWLGPRNDFIYAGCILSTTEEQSASFCLSSIFESLEDFPSIYTAVLEVPEYLPDLQPQVFQQLGPHPSLLNRSSRVHNPLDGRYRRPLNDRPVPRE
ncbi:hypothetical protein PTTG_12110, partial [Puccinia triticina 1-1 BBBD Race 1]